MGYIFKMVYSCFKTNRIIYILEYKLKQKVTIYIIHVPVSLILASLI